MSSARRFWDGRLGPNLAVMSMLACASGADRMVAGGQRCEQADECEAGWLCFEGICRKICNAHQDCEKKEVCQPGVCMPVADYECDEDTDCNAPSACESVLDAECFAGACHYERRAEGLACDDDNDCTSNDQCDSVGVCRGETVSAGSTCDDDNGCTSNDRCDSAGVCSGEAMVCNTPPADSCSPDDTRVRRYASAGVCNPSQGSCEYRFEDSACDDCRHACLHLPYAPENLAASAGDAQVTLTWDGVDRALVYGVYVSQTAGDAAFAEPVSAVGPPYLHGGLINGFAYYFAVSAVVEAGEGDLSDEVSATPRISAPAQVSAQSGDQQVTLTWEPVDGADRYNLYWALDPGVTLGSSRVSDVTSPYVHASLVNSTRYYYALTAVDGPSESEMSVEVSASTLIDTGTKLTAPDAEAGDQFGESVSLSGDYGIVGASYENGGGPLPVAGAAYVFFRTGADTWDSGTKLVAPDAEAGDQFGEAVSLSGDWAIVGATLEDGGPGNPLEIAGAAYVFHRTGANIWDSGTKLVAPDAQSGDLFGKSVSLSGDYAVVGAPCENVGAGGALGNAGAAYVFHRTGASSWDTGTKLVAPDAQADDQFGRSVSLSGDYAIVGATFEDGGAGDPLETAGAAYVFRRTAVNSWDAGAKLVASDAQADDWFGNSVSLGGDYAIVGAAGSDGGGAAYVFHRTGANTWDSGTRLVAPDAQAGDGFGESVSLSGDYAIVGASGEDGGAGDPLVGAGAAYVFRRTGPNRWDTGTKLTAPDAQEVDLFGCSVSLDGDHAIVGAMLEDGGEGDPVYDAGAAYVFEF